VIPAGAQENMGVTTLPRVEEPSVVACSKTAGETFFLLAGVENSTISMGY